MTVYLVVEGELYHSGYIPHAVFRKQDDATTYASELILDLGGVRWHNVYVYQMEVDVPGVELVEFEESHAHPKRTMD